MIGSVKVKIDGLNAGKIVNALVDNGVLIKNLVQKTKTSIFEIDVRDEDSLKKICKRYRKKYNILSKNNFVNFLKRSRYYIGSLLAMLLVSFFAFWSNLFVYKINIRAEGEQEFNFENINLVLADSGVLVGMKKKNVNINNIEKLIIASQKNISSCTVKKNGGILDIVLYPGTLQESIFKDNIYSKYNAVITSVDIYAGKTKLKVGDIVRVGDLLIENDNGASGCIMAKIYYSDCIVYNEKQVVKEFTGRELTQTRFSILNKIIGKSAKNNQFSNYLEENCVFIVSNNTFIPIGVVKTKYREFEYKDEIVKFESVEDELKQKLYLDVFKMVPEGFNVRDVTYSVVAEDNLTRLDCFIECEIDLLS